MIPADHDPTLPTIDGEIDGQTGELPRGTLTIVASRYHRAACDAMTLAAIETFENAGVARESIRVLRVPGAWELPLVVQTALDAEDSIGVVAIGVVIRGETTHDEHINRAVSLELMQLTTQFGQPVGLALLTCNNAEQVAERTGGAYGNKGTEAAEAVLELLRLGAKLV